MRTVLKIALPLVGIGVASMASADVLQSVSFWVQASTGTTIDYNAQVYAWSGNLYAGNPNQGAVGAALYDSGPTVYNGNGLFQQVSFAPNVNLAPGNYVALLTAVGGNGTAAWGLDTFQHVAGDGGGGFNYYNNVVGQPINNGAWDDGGDVGDAAWLAPFSSGTVYNSVYAWTGASVIPWGTPDTATYGQTFVVGTPEPASFLPVAAGVIGLLWRRRKTS